MRLLYVAHATAEILPQYRTALGPDVDIVPFVGPPLPGVDGGGMSSRYQALAQRYKSKDNGRRVLPGLVKMYPPPRPIQDYSEIWLATWSAGYALARELAADDIAQITGLVLLDSGHTDKDADGTARDAGVAWAVAWAKLAKAGSKVFAIDHTDVKTYGTTASTTQFAAEVVRLAACASGLFTVTAHDVSKSDNAEHVAALRGHGAEDVARAMASWSGRAEVAAVAPTDPPPAEAEVLPDSEQVVGGVGPAAGRVGLTAAILLAAEADLDACARESWGHNDGPEIRRLYLDPLKVPHGSSYCAAALTSWKRRGEEASGRLSKIAGGAGAQAMMAQAKAAGLWTPAGKPSSAERRAFVASLRPGHWMIADRSTPGKPDTAWMGHAMLICDIEGGSTFNIEGNADRVIDPATKQIFAVCMVERPLDDPRLFGAGRWE